MKRIDIGLAVFIILLALVINNPGLFSMENLISFGIIAAIVLIISIVVVRDYTPILQLRKSEAEFADDLNEDKMFEALEAFKNNNKMLSYQFRAYMMEAQLHLFKAEYTDALDSLLYCDKRDMNTSDKLRFMLLKAKILSFMDIISDNMTIFRDISEINATMTLSDRFNYLLSRGYADVRNNDLESARKRLSIMSRIINESSYKSVILQNELRWLESVIKTHETNDPVIFNQQFTLLKTMNCKPYIINNFSLHDPQEKEKIT